MATAEARAKQMSKSVGEIREALGRIEAKLGLPDGAPPAPAVPLAAASPEAKAKKTLRTLDEIKSRLATIEAAVGGGAAVRPPTPDDIHKANQSLRGDPTPKRR